MKKCPVCGTKYANDKEFCDLDRALLVECEDEKEKLKEVIAQNVMKNYLVKRKRLM